MGIGSLVGKWLGGGGKSAESSPASEPVEYNGFTITAEPLKEGGQYKTAGTITKEINGELRSAHFIRADNHSDHGAAAVHSERKGQQIVDEQGERMFELTHI